MNILIHNSSGCSNCLSVPTEDWQKAIKEEHLTLSAFCLYLFLADHNDKELIDLDRKMFEDATGFKKTSYNDAIRSLKDKGYLIQISEQCFAFYTSPLRVGGSVPEYMFGEA